MTKIRKVVLFALIRDNKILLEQRQLKGFSKRGHFIPGGLIEKREKVEEALVREMQEELGITPLVFRALSKKYLQGINNNVLMPYIVTSWKGEIPEFILDKNDPLEWVELNKALPLLPKEASAEIITAIKINVNNL